MRLFIYRLSRCQKLGEATPGAGRQEGAVTVPLRDLALVLHLPAPTVVRQRCAFCGEPCGAHYCRPREEARLRLSRVVTAALSAASPSPVPDPPSCAAR